VRIAVCRPQQPFVRGGAEIFTDRLVDELRERGHEADIVSVPLQTWPNPTLLASGLMWRFVDLRPKSAAPADLVIATKFPSYLVEHPNKVVWLVHQLRQAYELDGTEHGQLGESPFDRAIREGIVEADRYALAQARRLFATSPNVAARLRQSTGLEAEVMPHPPQELPYRCDRYEPFVLSVGRLDAIKRVDLLLEAAALTPSVRIVVAGEGPDRARLEGLGASRGLADRVSFVGRVDEQTLADLYATCRAVYYAPVDEDFGMVPLEAFRSGKPVITASDSGGPLDFVLPGRTGWVVEPEARSLAAALAEAFGSEETARRYGVAGRPVAEAITWNAAIARLLGSALEPVEDA
jgi:glycosyltransferase involved in cell wall biosynthesis